MSSRQTSPAPAEPTTSAPSNTLNRRSSSGGGGGLSVSSFPTVLRKPFPKALLIQGGDPVRRQQVFVGLTSKRFCVTMSPTPHDALSLLKFPAGSNGDFDVTFLDCENFEAAHQNFDFTNGENNKNNNSPHDDPLAASLNQSSREGTSSRAKVISGLQFTHSVRLREHAAQSTLLSSTTVTTTSSKKNKQSVASLATDEAISNNKQLQFLLGLSMEEQRKKKERELEEEMREKAEQVMLGLQAEGIVPEMLKEYQMQLRKQLRTAENDDDDSLSPSKVDTAKRNRSADVFSVNSLVPNSSQTADHARAIKLRPKKPSSSSATTLNSSSINAALSKIPSNAKIEDSVIGRFELGIVNEYHSTGMNGESGDDDGDNGDGSGGGEATISSITERHRNNEERIRMLLSNQESTYAEAKEKQSLALRGQVVKKLLASRSRHVIIGLCTSAQTREKLSDLVINMQTLTVQSYTKVPTVAQRENCIPLFDAVVRCPFEMHLDRLESIFVAREESIAQFAQAPTLKELSALLADLSERRVGGMLRITEAPDWRKLAESVAAKNWESTQTILQPVPKVYKVAKDTSGVSTHLTTAAIDDGHAIPVTTTNALFRAQADVKRARERLELERESLDAVNVELETSHLRNQELTRRIQQSLEDQKKLEEQVQFLSDQLQRKQNETMILRTQTEDAFNMAQETNENYERICSIQAKNTMEREKMIESYEIKIDRLKRLNGKRGGSAGGGKNRAITYANVGGTAVPLKSVNNRKEPTGAVVAEAEKATKSSNNIEQQEQEQQQIQTHKYSSLAQFHQQYKPSNLVQKQDARCVEIDLGIDAPIYLDLLTQSRTKCLDYMRENTRLRQEVFDCQSQIFQLLNTHVKTMEDLGIIKFQIGQATTAQDSAPAGHHNTGAKSLMQNHDTFFASFRRMNQSITATPAGITKPTSTSFTSVEDVNSSTSKRPSTVGAVATTTTTIQVATRNDDDDSPQALIRKFSTTMMQIQHAAGSESDEENEEEQFQTTSRNSKKDRRAFTPQEQKQLLRATNRKWKSAIQRQSAAYERKLMEAHDIVSSVTIEENVFNLIKSGVRMRTATFNYEKLQDVRCRADFADDAVTGALNTEAHAVISRSTAEGTSQHHHRNLKSNPNEALDDAEAELLGTMMLSQQPPEKKDTSPNNNSSKKRRTSSSANPADRNIGGASSPASSTNNKSLRKKLKNAAVNIANSGSGGIAASVINSVIENAQQKSQEPVRAFLRKSLEGMWASVRSVTQSTTLDVMTTHAALSAGLERLLSGSGFPSTTNNTSATPFVPQPPSTPQSRNLSSPSSQNLQLHHQQQPQVLMRREKQQQLAQSLRRLFLDRLTSALTKLSDNLSESFSRHVYETYIGGVEVMEREIYKAVQPVALENARLATSLLMAKTAAHNQLGLLLQQHRERERELILAAKMKKQQQQQQQEDERKAEEERLMMKSRATSSRKKKRGEDGDGTASTEKKKNEEDDDNIALKIHMSHVPPQHLPDYFGKEVSTRDGWCQTRPVLIRDPMGL